MANKHPDSRDTSVGMWAKRCYLAARAAMEDALRPYDLGATQWYVLYQLANEGPTLQRELQRILQVERATLSVVVTTLVRKGLVEQLPDDFDQRQKLLRLTAAGVRLWTKLPDLSRIEDLAFSGMKAADLANAAQVLRMATERLEKSTREDVIT
ncbi:MarR family transcriptional regulator [Mycobacterium sp. ENV421]|uniref:MarR family winged helix-turn-helix transcriptional regulator n=1 Tax=Mycobacterium sp. ENV421 TaxID=1213407 RepID=UPI001E30B132|nr:MarR family transcriptional regulator [Mycobacterium sp. ENV421]